MNKKIQNGMNQIILKQNGIKPAWRMGYQENKSKPHTDKLPTFAGFHATNWDKKTTFSWTLRYGDGYYCMVLSYRVQGVLPFNKHGCLKLRCSTRGCYAKALIKCGDNQLLENGDYKALRSNPDLWTLFATADIAHNCGKKVPYYYSDKINFGEDYRQLRELYDDGTDLAWTMATKTWTSGFGPQFDGMIQGLKNEFRNKVRRDRRKTAPTNKFASTAFDLIVPETTKTIPKTTIGLFGEPIASTQEFYRETDRFGQKYFMTPDDSLKLHKQDSLFFDATFKPVAGERFFTQLAIICARLEISSGSSRPTIMSFPLAWIYMTGSTTEHYEELFDRIKAISRKDRLAAGEPDSSLNPLFIHADGELAIRRNSELLVW